MSEISETEIKAMSKEQNYIKGYSDGKKDVIDKIRVEIERKAHSGQWSDATMYGMLKAVAIIDKYIAESEVQE